MPHGLNTCPTCGQRLPEVDPLGAVVAQLETWCETTGHHIETDGCVDSRAAAAILSVSEGHLRNVRYVHGDERLKFHRHGRSVRYALADLAERVLSARRAG